MGKPSRAALKIVVLGPSCVGKTALVQRLVLGVFLEDYQETLEDVYNKTIVLGDGVLVDLCVVDLGGAPVGTANSWHPLLERQIAQAENADAVILCYSITNRTSLDECINVYRNVLGARGGEPVPAILVGTMLDSDHDRQVRTETAKRLSERVAVSPCPFLFMEVSSLQGKAINVFYEVARVSLAYRQQSAVHTAVGGPSAKRLSSSSRPPTARSSATSSSTGSATGSTQGSDVDFDPNLTVSSRGSSRLSATPHLSSNSSESAESQDASISSGGSTRSAPLPRSTLTRSVSTGSVNLPAMPVARTSSGGPNSFRQSFRQSLSDNRQTVTERSSAGIITGSIRRRGSTLQRAPSMRPRGFSSPQLINNPSGPQAGPIQVVQSQPGASATDAQPECITEHHRSFSASDVRRQAIEQQPRLMRRSETAGRLTPQTPPVSDLDRRKGKSEQSLAEKVKQEVESNLGARFESLPSMAAREKPAAAAAGGAKSALPNDEEEPYMVRRKNFRKSWRHSTRALPHAFSDDLWLEARPDEFGIREGVGTSDGTDPGIPTVKSALAAVGENDADHSLEHMPEQQYRADLLVPRVAPRPASLGVKPNPRPISRPTSQAESNTSTPSAATTRSQSAQQVNRQSVHEGSVVDTEEVDEEEEPEMLGSEESGRDTLDGENERESSPHPSSSSSSGPVDGNTPAKTPKTPRLGFIGRSLRRMSTRSAKSTVSDTVESPIESAASSDTSEPSSPEYKKQRKEKANSLLGSLKRGSSKRGSGSGAKTEPAVVVA